ncbi:MAG: amidohydrolase [Reyranellaceae bacterium]
MGDFEVLDAQIHIWERDSPIRPWNQDFVHSQGIAALTGGSHVAEEPVTVERALQAMATARIDGAVVVSPSLYGYDSSYALEAARRFPDRFGVVGYLDSQAPDIDEQVQRWRARQGALGLRVLALNEEGRSRLRDGWHRNFFAAAQRHNVPVCIYPPRGLREVALVQREFPDLRIVVDHLGLPRSPGKVDKEEQRAQLPDLLALAAYPTVSVKITTAPLLSAEPFPYSDLWPLLHGILNRFGPERTMWGSDWTRAEKFLSYVQGIDYIRETAELSSGEKASVLGGALRRAFGWMPANRSH